MVGARPVSLSQYFRPGNWSLVTVSSFAPSLYNLMAQYFFTHIDLYYPEMIRNPMPFMAGVLHIVMYAGSLPFLICEHPDRSR